MPNRLFLFICLCFDIFLISKNAYADPNDDVLWVSIINLIATPERYHGKKIFVTGWVNVGKENRSLCLSDKVLSSKECLWINAYEELDKNGIPRLEIYQHKVVAIHATFNMEDTGHFGGWSGGLDKVTDIYLKE